MNSISPPEPRGMENKKPVTEPVAHREAMAARFAESWRAHLSDGQMTRRQRGTANRITGIQYLRNLRSENGISEAGVSH